MVNITEYEYTYPDGETEKFRRTEAADVRIHCRSDGTVVEEYHGVEVREEPPNLPRRGEQLTRWLFQPALKGVMQLGRDLTITIHGDGEILVRCHRRR